MPNSTDGGGEVDSLLSAAAQTTDMRTRSALISEATASRMSALGISETETSVPALEEVMDDLAIPSLG